MPQTRIAIYAEAARRAAAALTEATAALDALTSDDTRLVSAFAEGCAAYVELDAAIGAYAAAKAR